MHCMIAPTAWTPENPNPFTPDGSYTPSWSCFSIKGGLGDGFYTSRTTAGCWLARFETGVANLIQRFADYVRYENSYQRTVILDAPDNIDPQVFIKQAEEAVFGPTGSRPSDPQYVVHSTTIDSWNAINTDNELKAASLTSSRLWPSTSPHNEVEQYLKKEPPEYREYIMFGSIGSSTPEMILASYAAGRFILKDDVPYSPGARLYFDNTKIVTAGLCTRDGIHETKVLNRLQLKGYLMLVVTAADLTLPESERVWTPRTFANEADAQFFRHLSGNGKCLSNRRS